MKRKQAAYTTDVRDVYATELRRMQKQLNGLRENLETVIGEGILPDNIGWADVGGLKRLNNILSEALEISI